MVIFSNIREDELLCGPILRRVTSKEVYVWCASLNRMALDLKIYQAGHRGRSVLHPISSSIVQSVRLEEHLTWAAYPYFWRQKIQWDERIAYEDTDPLLNGFLKAVYCRVTVPARPGFEGAIDHFMSFGEIGNGGPLPPIVSPLYLPIADELVERLDRPGDEFPEGDPWIVRVPTTLVHLRATDKLPRWKQDVNGQWVEDKGGA